VRDKNSSTNKGEGEEGKIVRRPQVRYDEGIRSMIMTISKHRRVNYELRISCYITNTYKDGVGLFVNLMNCKREKVVSPKSCVLSA